MRRLLHAATNTWQGLRAAARTEQAFRQELLVLVIALPTAFWVAQENWKRLILIGALVLLLITELLNTAIEKLADRISRESDVLIGEVKDMSSAAVGWRSCWPLLHGFSPSPNGQVFFSRCQQGQTSDSGLSRN